MKKIRASFNFFGLALATWPVNANDKWDINKLDVSKLPPAADKQNSICRAVRLDSRMD
jgi:hypothetical protein